jgi:predicted HAD superfamily Cof-like phosphohydrolase
MPVPTNFEQVKAFHAHFDLPRPRYLTALTTDENHTLKNETIHRIAAAETFIRSHRAGDDVFYGRVQMMLEELREFVEAYQQGHLTNQVDSLVDLVYFALGTAVMMGAPFDECFAEVHRANMDKVRVASSAESLRLNKLDVRKPQGWRPPDLNSILARCTPEGELLGTVLR